MIYQFGMFALTFFNYACLHSTRSVWSAATKDLISLYDFSVSDIAKMNSIFLFAYSAGGVAFGQLADRYKLKYLIPVLYTLIALSISSLGVLHYVLKTPESQRDHIWLYDFLKFINGLLQSPGWALNLVVLANWFPSTGRGLLLGVWACNTTIGDMIGTYIYQKFSKNAENDWSLSFFIVGGFVILVGILNLLFLIQSPSEIGMRVDNRDENEE